MKDTVNIHCNIWQSLLQHQLHDEFIMQIIGTPFLSPNFPVETKSVRNTIWSVVPQI